MFAHPSFKAVQFANSGRSSRWLVRALIAAFLLLAVPSLMGCEEEIDVTTEDGLKKALSEKKKLPDAMEQLKTMASEKEELATYGSELNKLFLDGSDHDMEILGYLVKIESADYEEAYIKAVESGDAQQIRMASAPIGALKLKGAVNALVSAYQGTADQEIKRVVMEVGTQFEDPAFAQLATELLTDKDPTDVPIGNLRFACRVLERQRDPNAVPALLKASFYSDEAGRNIGEDCAAAVLAVGAPAIPEIIKMYEGQNEAINKFIEQFDDRLTIETVQLRAVTLLGKLRATAARDVLLKHLEDPTPIQPPPTLAKKPKSDPAWFEWAGLIGQTTQESLFALNDIGLGENNEAAVTILMAMYKWQEPYPAKYKQPNDMANMVEVSARVNAARVLAENGYLDDALIQEVLAALKDPDFDDIRRLRPAARASIVTDLVTYLAIASQPGWHDTVWKFFSELSANELADDPEAKIKFDLEPARKRIAMVQKTFALADECSDPACFAKVFAEKADGDVGRFRQIKAVYELGKSGNNEHFEMILNAFVDMDAFGYMFAAEALARLGTADDVPKIDALLADIEQNRGGQLVKLIGGYLKPLKATLVNKTK